MKNISNIKLEVAVKDKKVMRASPDLGGRRARK